MNYQPWINVKSELCNTNNYKNACFLKLVILSHNYVFHLFLKSILQMDWDTILQLRYFELVTINRHRGIKVYSPRGLAFYIANCINFSFGGLVDVIPLSVQFLALPFILSIKVFWNASNWHSFGWQLFPIYFHLKFHKNANNANFGSFDKN